MRELAAGTGRKLQLRWQDLTELKADALVNAANSQLQPGGGVDGAIHRAGGPRLQAELSERYPTGCPTGQAVVTGAGRLPARVVVHAVGPWWRGGTKAEPELLAQAYRSAFSAAAAAGCRSVGCCSISTGIYGFPIELAAPIALEAALQALGDDRPLQRITFCLFSAGDLDSYSTALTALAAERPARARSPS